MGEDREAHLDRVLVGDREPAPIAVVDCNRVWLQRLQDIAERLRQVLGEDALRASSVPGLAAKPIVDALLGVTDDTAEGAYAPAAESVRFVLQVREPAHRMLRTPAR